MGSGATLTHEQAHDSELLNPKSIDGVNLIERRTPRFGKFRAAFAFNVGTRLLSVLGRVIAVPISMALLTVEQYGLWLMISSLTGWLAFANLGIPSAAQNQLALEKGKSSHENMNSIVAYSLRCLSVGGLLVVLLVSTMALAAPWKTIWGIDSENALSFAVSLVLVGVAIGIQLPAKMGTAICNAHGEIAWPSIAELVTQVVSIMAILVVYAINWKSLVALAAVSLVSLSLSPLILAVLAMRRYEYRLTGIPLSRLNRTRLLGKGVIFLLVSIGELLVLQTDAFVVGFVKGSAYVPLLLVPLALWSNCIQLQNTFLNPVWPLLTIAIAEKNELQLQQIIWRASWITITFSLVMAGGLLLFAKPFITFWTLGTINVSNLMVFGIAIYVVVGCIDNLLATILNAFNAIEYRLSYTVLCGIVKVSTAIVMLRFFNLDILPLAFAIVMFLFATTFALFGVHQNLEAARAWRQSSSIP